MSTLNRLAWRTFVVVVSALIFFGALEAGWHFLFPTPVEIFYRNEAAIREYVASLEAGRIPERSEDQGYLILDLLGRHGATHVQREGECVVVTFGFMPTDPVPQLWYSPAGFSTLPAPFAQLKAEHAFFKWRRIRDDWGYCEWDDRYRQLAHRPGLGKRKRAVGRSE